MSRIDLFFIQDKTISLEVSGIRGAGEGFFLWGRFGGGGFRARQVGVLG